MSDPRTIAQLVDDGILLLDIMRSALLEIRDGIPPAGGTAQAPAFSPLERHVAQLIEMHARDVLALRGALREAYAERDQLRAALAHLEATVHAAVASANRIAVQRYQESVELRDYRAYGRLVSTHNEQLRARVAELEERAADAGLNTKGNAS